MSAFELRFDDVKGVLVVLYDILYEYEFHLVIYLQACHSSDEPSRFSHLLPLQSTTASLATADVCPPVLHAIVSD